MSVERRLAETLHRADQYQPSEDLFSRVRRSIEEDAAHRRRLLKISAATVVFVGLLLAAGWTAAHPGPSGRLAIDRGVLEALETMVLVVLVAVLGPAIRRFGRTYAADMFRIRSGAAETFLVLLDLAYYMVFGGYVLVTAEFAALGHSVRLAVGLEGAALRVGGLLLLMGVLHSLTIVVLPMVGLLFSSSIRRARRHLAGSHAPPPHPEAVVADRLAQAVVWVAAGLAVFGLLAMVLMVVVSSIP